MNPREDTSRIPVLDLAPQIGRHWEALNAAFQRVLQSGHFILGPEVAALEAEIAAYLGVRHAVGLNSGTDALTIALRALGIGPGDEVITTPFTFFATAEAISHLGATPVFADIEPGSFNLDPDQVEAALTSRTRAIIPVHLFGRPCAMERLQPLADRHGLALVEDCAQSLGAVERGRRTGARGAFGCLSFFPTKNLNAFGDAGMLVTDDEALAASARMLRAHGSRMKYHNECVGYNSRLDELHAALLRVKLPWLDAWNEGRRQAAASYHRHLAAVPGLVLPAIVDGHVFHQFTVRIGGGRRNQVQALLDAAGIGSMVYYPVPLHHLRIYRESHRAFTYPVAEAAAQEVLSLPLWPEIGEDTIARVAGTLAGILAGLP